MDAFAVLRADHERVLEILDRLQSSLATTDELEAERKRLVTELVMQESAHEAVEEQYFWPSVSHWLDEGRSLTAHALEQEQKAKKLLRRLERTDVDDAMHGALLARVIEDGRRHIEFEEREVWPALRERLVPTAIEELGSKMAEAKRFAPSRPHPHTPPRPVVLKTAGLGAAIADRIRDAVSGRGRG